MRKLGRVSLAAMAAMAAVDRALGIAEAGTGETRFKAERDVVTDADVGAEDAIRDALAPLGFPVVGEERGGEVPADGAYWLVDPICGTRNFASGIPYFAVNVALVEDGEPVLAAVGDGGTGALYVAERGNGSFVRRSPAASLRPIEASASSRVVNFDAWPPAGGRRDRAGRVIALAIARDRWDVRVFASTLALAHLATGRLAGAVFFEVGSPVHIAAGVLLAREAGATVTDVGGGPWAVGNDSIIASADAALHGELLELLSERGTS